MCFTSHSVYSRGAARNGCFCRLQYFRRQKRDSFVLHKPWRARLVLIPRTCKTPTNIQKAKRSVQSSYCYCLRQSIRLPDEKRSLWNVSVLKAMMMEMHIVLHSHNSIFVFVFACFFAFWFSFQFLNTLVTAKLQRETVPTERRVIDLCRRQKNALL